MKSRLPAFLDKDKICIICEGDEEFDYLNRLKDLGVWNEKYEVSLDNADGMEIFRQDIRTAIKTVHMKWY